MPLPKNVNMSCKFCALFFFNGLKAQTRNPVELRSSHGITVSIRPRCVWLRGCASCLFVRDLCSTR